MKIRIDFVSNSSSCSFFIELNSQAAVDAFKQIISKFNKNEVKLSFYNSIQDVFKYDDMTIEDIEVGTLVKCDSGEDHDIDYRDRFNRMVDVVDNNPSNFKFKIYDDPDAHITHPNAIFFPD